MPSLQLTQAPNAQLDSKQSAVINKFVNTGSDESRGIALHKVGTGKTRLAYGWFLYLRQQGRASRCLAIIRPKAIHDWRAEADRIGYDRESINFVSFANLKTVDLRIEYDTIIIDELYLFGNPKSYRAKRLSYLSGRATNVLGLSGTILSKDDNTAIWGYCVAVGISGLIARGITHFRSLYQTSFEARFNRQVKLFRPKVGWEQQIYSALGNHVSVYFPPRYTRTFDTVTKVPLSKQQIKLINKLVKYYVLDSEDGEVFLTRATEVFHRVRQITNGWIQLASGRLQLVECEKRDATLEKMGELSESAERCVVWCAYRNDVRVLQDLFPSKTVALVGGKSFDLLAWESGRATTVVATMGSGQSINFLNSATFGLFFSLSSKRLDWQQSRGRMGRRGVAASGINFIRFAGVGSLDEKIYRRIQETEDAEESLIAEFQKTHNIRLPL